MENLLYERRRRFRATGIAVFVMALGLLLSRIIAQLLPESIPSLTTDIIFTILVQVVFLGGGTFLVYWLYLKKKPREIFELSNFRKTDYRILLLCIPLGACVLVATTCISSAWYMLLKKLGYSPSGGTAILSEFRWYNLLVEIVLTGLAPAIFEEFIHRGGLLSTMRGSYDEAKTVIIAGVIFGLFHQSITQVFYTALFGALMAFLVLRTKSIYPAMVIHAVNNSLSVYNDYAKVYSNLPLHSFFSWINNLMLTAFPIVMMMFFAIIVSGVAIFFLILYLTRHKKSVHIRAIRNVSDGSTIVAVEDESLDDNSTPVLEDTLLYKPTPRDYAFYIGGLVITILTTICSFVWGVI